MSIMCFVSCCLCEGAYASVHLIGSAHLSPTDSNSLVRHKLEDHGKVKTGQKYAQLYSLAVVSLLVFEHLLSLAFVAMVVFHGVDFGQNVNRSHVQEGPSGDQHEDADPELEHSKIVGLTLAEHKTKEDYHVHQR